MAGYGKDGRKTGGRDVAGRPITFVTPGEIVGDYLAALGMTPGELAERIGLPGKTVDGIMRGEGPITVEIAGGLEKALGRPARFWMAMESDYRDELAREARPGKR
jgi:addiction module HigA family antidote